MWDNMPVEESRVTISIDVVSILFFFLTRLGFSLYLLGCILSMQTIRSDSTSIIRINFGSCTIFKRTFIQFLICKSTWKSPARFKGEKPDCDETFYRVAAQLTVSFLFILMTSFKLGKLLLLTTQCVLYLNERLNLMTACFNCM